MRCDYVISSFGNAIIYKFDMEIAIFGLETVVDKRMSLVQKVMQDTLSLNRGILYRSKCVWFINSVIILNYFVAIVWFWIDNVEEKKLKQTNVVYIIDEYNIMIPIDVHFCTNEDEYGINGSTTFRWENKGGYKWFYRMIFHQWYWARYDYHACTYSSMPYKLCIISYKPFKIPILAIAAWSGNIMGLQIVNL